MRALLAGPRSARGAKLALSGALLAAVLLATGLTLALPRPSPPRPAQITTGQARATRDERSEAAFWRRQAQSAVASPTPSALPSSAQLTAIPTAPTTPGATATPAPTQPAAPSSVQDAIIGASREFGVPAPLLAGICYMEGRLSDNGGAPSIDDGFGCMHLVRNSSFDTLDQAAQDLGVDPARLRTDIATNIRGGAAVLRDDALQVSSTHALPTALGDWYGAVLAYSSTATVSVAHLYADALYHLLNTGFSAPAETGETITLAPLAVQPSQASAQGYTPRVSYPSGCSAPDANVDYPGAVDCILNPATFGCAPTATTWCSYDEANRPNDLSISFVAIHDIEGTVASALSVFQTVNAANPVSVHYIVGADGTVYQVLHEHDIAWHVGNYWYNQHAVGIEHEGYDATGYQWYNATEYLASAKLTAYLAKKYHIPLDRDHIVAHGTVPGPTLATMPNHVDPGPYWLWGYYFTLIHQQGVPFPPTEPSQHLLVLYPPSAAIPSPSGGFPESSTGNFSFFSLYNGPSTASGLIPHATSDLTEETFNVESGMTFYYLAKQPDPAGSGDTMYEIWYGESDRLAAQSELMDGKLAWLAVPPGDGVDQQGPLPAPAWVPAGTPIELTGSSPAIYGEPASSSAYIVGGAPGNTITQPGAVYVSEYTTVENGTTNLWYEINFNHRQAWVPATEVMVLPHT